MVWRLDRLGRGLRHLIIDPLRQAAEAELALFEFADQLTTTSSGRLVFHIFGAIAEFERQLIGERTQRGCRRRAPADGSAAAGR